MIKTESPAATTQVSEWRDVLVLILLGLVIRLAWVKFGSWESGDSQWYLATARNIAQNHFFSFDGDNPTAFRPPLYSSLIAALWFGESPVFTVLMVQVLLGAFTVGLVYLIARRKASRSVALLAGAGLALALMSGRFTAVILSETLFTSLVTLGMFFWSGKRFGLSGIAFGLGALTRVTLLPFVVLLPLLTLARPWRMHRRGYMIIALVSLAVCSIWIVRNAIAFHRFIPVAASGYGTNLFLGSLELKDADDVSRRKLLLANADNAGNASAEDETAFDRVRLSAAFNRIAASPSRWLIARVQQYPRLFIDSGSYLFGSEGIPLGLALRERKTGQVLIRSVLIMANAVVLLLAVVGVMVRRLEFVNLSEIVLFPIYLAVVALPLWIEPRYGLPMMPALVILSAIGTVQIWRRCFGRG